MKNIDYGTRMYERLDVVGHHILVQRFEMKNIKPAILLFLTQKNMQIIK